MFFKGRKGDSTEMEGSSYGIFSFTMIYLGVSVYHSERMVRKGCIYFAALIAVNRLVEDETEVYPRFKTIRRALEVFDCIGELLNRETKGVFDAPILFEVMLNRKLGNSAEKGMTIGSAEHQVFVVWSLKVIFAKVQFIARNIGFQEHRGSAAVDRVCILHKGSELMFENMLVVIFYRSAEIGRAHV